jgi:anti-sigma regulatory factor (Ser/Thr protein kinase)/biotin operon repressor
LTKFAGGIMRRVYARGEDICRYILQHVEAHPSDIAKVTAEHFKISRQAVNKHLQRLVREKSLKRAGKTRNVIYKLAPLEQWVRRYVIDKDLAEDVVWTRDIKPTLGELPDNVMNIWHHGFTEMFNNAIDHSEGRSILVAIDRTAVTSEMMISDDGVGIFRKIQRAKDLLDVRHAILELSKGKLTTDPRRHSGEGIFFTSRMFDSFRILSDGAYFSHELGDPEDWLLEHKEEQGTAVWMKLQNHTARTTKKIFDQYAYGDDVGFSKTVVPVRLAQYGNDLLISRSQAKRVLARVEQFRNVVFDFREVESIGQAFADEVFRVFALEHPEIDLLAIHANSAVKRMIAHVKAGS